MVDEQRASVVKALFVRLVPQDGKGDEVEHGHVPAYKLPGDSGQVAE